MAGSLKNVLTNSNWELEVHLSLTIVRRTTSLPSST